MKRISDLTRRALWQTPLIWLALALGASAQIGGPSGAPKPPPARPAPPAITQRVEKEGIAVEFSLVATPDEKQKAASLVAGSDAVATLRLTDTRTGQPVT